MRIDKDKLTGAMAAKGIFIRDLCKRVNMTEPTLKRILSVGGDADTQDCIRIACVLNVRVEELEERTRDADE